MKARKYIFALLSAALLCSCTDKDDILVDEAEQNPAQEIEPITLVASINDAKTRVAYSEVDGIFKVSWVGPRTENFDGHEVTIPGDFLMVFPGKSDRSQIKLSSHDLTDEEKAAKKEIFEYDSGRKTYKIKEGVKYESDKAYEFEIVQGAGEGEAKFKYTGKMIWYEESESTVEETVSSASNSTEHKISVLRKTHTVVKKPVSEVDEAEELSIAEGFTALALWEHPDNESGDCQTANNSTAHLKYQEVLTAQLAYSDFTTNTEVEKKANITLTHPKTVIFKIVMNQFLYNIHRGSHVGIMGLTLNNETGAYEKHFIDGVYHQARSEFFEYNQTVEPARILTVTPANNGLGYGETVASDGKVFAGDLDAKLTTYMMVDASKLAGYDAFQFSLTDNWSHDLYIWRLKLNDALTADCAGKFFTVDLTNRVCNQFVWMGDDEYLWAIRNHKANRIEQDGGFYRYGELTSVMTNPDVTTFTQVCETLTPDNYGHKDWLTTIRGFTPGYPEEFTGSPVEKINDEYYQFKSESKPGFLIESGEKIHINSKYYKEYRLDYQYDAIYQQTKGLMEIPTFQTILNFYLNFDTKSFPYQLTTYNNVQGIILTNSKGHKIFMPQKKEARPSNYWSQEYSSSDETNVPEDLLIATSSFGITVLMKTTTNFTRATYITMSPSNVQQGDSWLNRKAIYHPMPLRGVAKVLHKAERSVTGEVNVSSGDDRSQSGGE